MPFLLSSLKSLCPRRWLCVFVATVAATCFSFGREPEASSARRTYCETDVLPQTLSLAEARRIAFLHNWDLLAAQANVDQALAQQMVSREFPNPMLAYSTGKISTDSAPNSTTLGNQIWNRNYDTIVAVSQLYEIGGKRTMRQKSAVHGLKAAEASFKDARRTLDLGVGKAYIAVLLAEANVAILHESADSLRRQAKIAEARLNAGDISKSDKAQIDIAADQLDLNAEAATSTAKAARIALEVLLGVKSPTGDWHPTDKLETLATSDFIGRGPSGEPRPDILAADETLRKARYDLGLQKAMRIPDPTFMLQYEHNPPDMPNTIGVGVSLPLPLWNFNRGNIKAALAAQELAADQLGKVKSQAASDVISAKVALEEASVRWHRYKESIAPKSATVVKMVQYAYQKGGAALVDLLQAQRTDNDIRLAAAQAMADAASAAAALANALNITSDRENTSK